ncbi:MAG: bifunctional 4-hydroxy-2-oxoglutarate aldolase/2-dehydro-3-deoxy-phosphogluconate aldolase [Pseudomonadota bacterium]
MTSVIDRLTAGRVAPVIRTGDEATARRGVDILREEGFSIFEMTLTTPGALSIIRDLSGDQTLTVGVGTVLSPEQGEEAIDAGAEFVVSPAFIPGLGDVCRAAGAPMALGAATPTEALRAHEAGAEIIKVFPAAQLGGPGFIKALKSVYPEFTIMPTGGINPPDIAAYLTAGAACLGMGGNLVNQKALSEGDDDVIRGAARAIRAELEALA